MFQPENQIEKDLMRASAEPEARPAFARAILEAEVFVVLVPQDGPIVPGPDGNATIPAGTTLTLASAKRGDQNIVPFFTAPSRARAWFKAEHIVAPEKARTLFGRYPDLAFQLNPGSDFGKEYTPGEVKRMLAGDFDDGPQVQVADASQQVLLAHPKDKPVALIEALGRELGAVKAVRGAWLMLAMRAGQPDQSWMLGVDQSGDWDDVRAAIGRAVTGGVLQGRMLDAMPLDSGSISSTLRSGIPVIVKRGFFNLFR